MKHLFVGLLTRVLCQVPFKEALETLIKARCKRQYHRHVRRNTSALAPHLLPKKMLKML